MMSTSTPLTSDWQTGKTLSECFDYIFTSGTACDVKFLVGENKGRISAHKLVLISRSPVFYAMFEGPLAEKGDVTIPDICDDIFQLFLRYLYTDTIDLTEKNAVPVLCAARKYGVDILVSHCDKFLKENISELNVCIILEHAHMFMLEDLQNMCLRWIDEHPESILQSEFDNLCRICVTSIMESENLRTDESEAYTAVVKWADAECKRGNIDATPDNKREVLGDLLYTVRFSEMDTDFLQKKVCYDQILPAEEVVQTFNYQHHRVEASGSKLNHVERGNLVEQLWRVESIVKSEGILGEETVSFSVSDCVHLVGFGSFYSKGDNTVNVVIYENLTVVYKANNISRVKSRSDDIGEVLLNRKDRIHLQPGNVYTIAECTSHNRKCHGGLTRTEPQKLNTIEIKFQSTNVPFPKALGHNRQQVPYLLLK